MTFFSQLHAFGLLPFDTVSLPDGSLLSFSKLLETAIQAGEKTMEIYNEDLGVEYKEDGSPLTRADIESNTIICDALKALTPQISIISEETKHIPFAQRADLNTLWLIDPIDGTKEFIKKTGEFTVNIGLSHNGVPILGVVTVPAQDITYFAFQNKGSFKFDHKTLEITPIEVSTFSEKDSELRLVVSASHMTVDTQNFVSSYNAPILVSKGSSLKLLMIAEGSADIYPRIAPTMEWDTCAADAILREAGGVCLNYETNQPLRYNKENLRNPYFVCYGQRR